MQNQLVYNQTLPMHFYNYCSTTSSKYCIHPSPMPTFCRFSHLKPYFQHLTMEPVLTENTITLLLAGSTSLQPSLQIFELSLIPSTKTSSPHYRVSLFDGASQHRSLLPAAYNGHVTSGDLQLGSIIILRKAACTFLQNYAYIHTLDPILYAFFMVFHLHPAYTTNINSLLSCFLFFPSGLYNCLNSKFPIVLHLRLGTQSFFNLFNRRQSKLVLQHLKTPPFIHRLKCKIPLQHQLSCPLLHLLPFHSWHSTPIVNIGQSKAEFLQK